MIWSETIHLKGERETLEAALAEAFTEGDLYALDIIGDIYEGGTFDESGEVIDPPVKVDGWHANLRVVGEMPAVLSPFVIEVAHPVRVFA